MSNNLFSMKWKFLHAIAIFSLIASSQACNVGVRNFVNQKTNQCLETDGDGAVYPRPCSCMPSQRWNWTGTWIVNLGTNKCLGSYGTQVYTETCYDIRSQMWSVGLTGDLKTRNLDTNYCLYNALNGPIGMQPCSDQDYQKWLG